MQCTYNQNMKTLFVQRRHYNNVYVAFFSHSDKANPRKYKNRKGKLLPKFNLYISSLAEVFVDQKRINVCKHTIKVEPPSLLIVTTILNDLK